MMINSLCGSMGSLKSIKSEVGSLKSESSCTKMLPTSPNESSVLESKKAPLPLPLPSDMEQNGLLAPSSLNFPALKFEVLDEEMEIQSPDSSLWESFFTDQLDCGDFMISSPVRNNLPSPQGTNVCNYNSYMSMHGQSLLGCSPPRASSPLGPYGSNKGKGLSPLHRVLNSPNNNNQFMQVESLSLPALENFLDDYEREDEFSLYTASSGTGVGNCSSESYDALTTIPALLDCLTLPNNSSRFCGPKTSSGQGGNSQLSQESGVYQMGSMGTAPLLQQLQEERHQEKQQQQQHPPRRPPPQRSAHQQQQQQQTQIIDHTLMVPQSIIPEQVLKSLSISIIVFHLFLLI